jgi:peptidoglycan/LPS O-acetylase OafA/YrhL
MTPYFGEKMATLASSSQQQKHHIDSFDGIRGIAVLMVLIGHGGWFNNGWMGVDLFFVLSGFLITGILRRSRKEKFYWRRFYIKRATRILPPLVLAIAVAALLWPHTTAIGLVGYLVSLGNVVDCTRFNIIALQHLWSLSVEEHYYLFWPFAILLLPKRQLQRLLVAIVIVVPLLRFVFTYLLPGRNSDPIYMLTPFRIDGIALGSFLALLLEDGSWHDTLKRWSGAAVVLASATYLLLWTTLGHVHFYPYAFSPIFNLVGYSLVAMTAFFVVAYAFLRTDAMPTRLLRTRLLVKLGEISYGVYVYSWIILHLIQQFFPSLPKSDAGLAHIILSVVVSAVLFRYYERPITLWGKRMAALLDLRNKDAATEELVPINLGLETELGTLVLDRRIVVRDSPARDAAPAAVSWAASNTTRRN